MQSETLSDLTSVDLPKQVRRFVLTVMPILVGLHVYIGWSLIPALPLGMLGTVVGWTLLSLSALLIPMSMVARFIVSNPALVDRDQFCRFVSDGVVLIPSGADVTARSVTACNRNTFACRHESNNGDLSGGSGNGHRFH